MFEYKDFFKVMLTPYELGIALGVYKWDSNLYFDRVLDKTDSGSDFIEDADENDVQDGAMIEFSKVEGNIDDRLNYQLANMYEHLVTQ